MLCFYFVADGITTCLADVIASMADGIKVKVLLLYSTARPDSSSSALQPYP